MKTKYIRLLFLVFSFIVLSGESKAQSCKTIWSLSYFGDNDFFHMPSDIEVDKARSLIYITDSGNNRIVVFDFQGQFKKSFGSLGQGPGEFNRPTGLFIFENGCLAVADYENLRIQLFDQNNAFIEIINTVNVRVADLIFTDNKYYTVSTYGASGYRLNQSEEKFQPLVTILDKEGKLTGEISVDDYPDTHPFIRAIKNRVCLTLSPDKKLFLPYFAINKIQIFDLDGKKQGAFEQPLSFKPILPKLLQQKSSEGVIQMQAANDIVTRDAEFGPDGLLYLLTCTESFQKLLKDAASPGERPLQKMKINVIDIKEYKVIRSLACDPSVYAFAWIDNQHLVYIHENEAGELILKCVEY